MIRVLCIFFLLLLSVWIGVKLQHDPGYVLVSIDHWTLETTVWVAILGLLLMFVMFHVFLLMLHWVIRIPASWCRWRGRQRIKNAQAKTRQGLIEFSEGHWQQAKNHLIKALPDTETPLLNYLTAARAAQEMGDNNLRDEYLREAQQSMPEAKIAVELTQAQLQLANRQWEQALATLRHLQDLAPHHPYVLKLLMHLYEEVKDWPQLIILLPALKWNQVVTDHEFDRLQHDAYLQAMTDLIKQDQLEVLTQFMDALPKKLRNDAEFMTEYCQYLLTKQKESEVELLLHRFLKKEFSEPLIALYGQVKHANTNLSFAESLLTSKPHSAALLLCLGRICQNKQLWGKAKLYFEQSLQYGPSPEAFMELGLLLIKLNDQDAASTAFQQGLTLAISKSSA